MFTDTDLARLNLNVDTLAGQTAVVTGAGRGIGRAVAILLARLGARVVIAELAEETGRETEQEIRALGRKALFVQTDIADATAIARLAEATVATFGHADILINNAIVCPVGPVLDMDIATWDRAHSVNLRGAFLTCKAFLPAMVARGRGTVVNMVSLDAMAYMSAYISSKQGLAAFTQCLAAEVGPSGVRAIALAPGFVDTPGLRVSGAALAPRLGMSEEQFLGLSLHAAYEGAMPVEHAAYATACLIAHLADAYHGEIVTGYQILEREGFITAAPLAAEGTTAAAPVAAPAAPPSTAPTTADRVPALTEATDMAAELKQMLAETEAEFGKLPVFVRPMARAGFRGKAGHSLQDWAQLAEKLSASLAEAARTNGASAPKLPVDLPRLRTLADKLITYYRGVPDETARFTKDQAFIAETTRICAARVATIGRLVAVLGQLLNQ